MNDVAVVVVTYNSRRWLEGCLGSITAAVAGLSSEVVVVDNASTDGTAAEVKRLLPSAVLLESAGNEGFAAANNLALRRTRSRHVLLLNPDTVLAPGAVTRLVRFLDADPSYWAAGPAVHNGNGTLQRTGVSFPSLRNIAVETLFLDRLFPRSRLFGRHRRLYEDPSVLSDVDYVQGSCLLVRRAAVDRVGPLDEEYFLYFEETDWCRRMRDAGGKVARVPDAAIVHFGGEPSVHYDEGRLVHYHRGLLLFFRRHRRPAARLLLRVLLAARSLVRIAAWTAVAVVSPGRRAQALSAARGYARVLPLLVREAL